MQKAEENEIKFKPSTFENIDYAVFNWLNEEMNIHCTTNKGWEKVDVTWVGNERARQVKDKIELRDLEGTLILPRITIERPQIDKDKTFKGVVQADLPRFPDYKGGSWGAFRTINQKKTSNFSNAQSYRRNNGRVGIGQINFKTKKQHPTVYTTYTMPIPSYIKIMYKIILRADYQQQANELMQPFLTFTGQVRRFMIENEGHRYEAFLEENFEQNNNVSAIENEERIYKTIFKLKVLGYLMGSEKNDDYPKWTKRENAVEFKQPRERVITQDQIEHGDNLRIYR